jgi:hypothetical protein
MLVTLCLLCGSGGALGAAADPNVPPSSDGPLRWTLGRTPDVFRPGKNVIATRIGGWADASYQDNNRDRAKAGINHVNIFLDTRYGESWQFFFESEYEREFDLSGFEDEKELEIEQAYARYRHSDRLHLRIGKFNAPFGYWIPVHWSILMDTIVKPIHDGNRVIPEQVAGLELAGRVFLDDQFGRDAELSYALYLGYGDETWAFEESDTDGWSFGSDLRLRLDQAYLLGVSLHQQDNTRFDDRTEQNIMLYAQAELPAQLTFRTEYLRQFRDERPNLSANANIWYAKLRWDFRPDAYFNYRYNVGDDDSTGKTLLQRVHTFSLGYQPLPPLRIKLEYSSNGFDRRRRDFNFWGVSVGYVF